MSIELLLNNVISVFQIIFIIENGGLLIHFKDIFVDVAFSYNRKRYALYVLRIYFDIYLCPNVHYRRGKSKVLTLRYLVQKQTVTIIEFAA